MACHLRPVISVPIMPNLNLLSVMRYKLFVFIHIFLETKVAFSLSLETTTDQHTGPFNTGKTLIFKHVFINVGGAYNSHTGQHPIQVIILN